MHSLAVTNRLSSYDGTMARKRDLERAKRRFLTETTNREWVQGVGVGLIEGQLGLIISVRPRTKPAASRLLKRLDLDVPIQVRAVSEIRARAPDQASKAESREMLRKAAHARFSDAK